MKSISLDYVAEVAGVVPHFLRDWVADGVLDPVQRGGKGRSRAHRFSLTQAVGIVVAVGLRQSERGCHLGYVSKVVEAFGAVSEEWLLEQFKKNRAHLLLVSGEKPILEAQRYDDQIDVQSAYMAVKKLAESAERKPVEV